MYTVEADWLIAADGARSPIRRMLGLEVEGKIFMDRFLIADVVMKADFPAERWFWFDPPFHPNQSVLLHKQTDSVFRIDFQLGWDADPEEEKKPENVIPRIKAMLGAMDGKAREFELEWVSVYTFQCRRMGSFNHGRVLFVGDAAHQVSPFGARGANSGLQDADNLGWKLKLVLDGKAPRGCSTATRGARLRRRREHSQLDPVDRLHHAQEPRQPDLPQCHPGPGQGPRLRPRLVNSGRLSVPAFYVDSSLNTPDDAADGFGGRMLPGAPMDDAPVLAGDAASWLLNHVGGGFRLMLFVDDPAALAADVAAR
jgi:3-(3-hydroxy-phenyl)propionate hydroxylase